MFASIKQGLNEAIDYERGNLPVRVDKTHIKDLKNVKRNRHYKLRRHRFQSPYYK